MLTSPPKRRKTSPTQSITIDAFNTDDVLPDRQTTPRRASYQSPTKASLARFNPGLLQRPTSQSPEKEIPGSETNEVSNGDADEIRSKRVKLFERVAPTSTTKKNEAAGHGEDGENIEQQAPSASMLSQPSKRYSRSPIRRAALHGTAVKSAYPPQSKSQATQPTDDGASVRQPRYREHERQHSKPIQPVDEGEPELPPTPVELGLEKRAPPPAGYISSSSPSGRSDRRKKRKTSEGVKSSPLKPRDQRPESEPDKGAPLLQLRPKQPDVSEEMVGKRQLKDNLTVQLNQLKYEVEKLESAVAKAGMLEQDEEMGEETQKDLVTILTTSNPSCASAPPPAPVPKTVSSLLSAFLPFASAPSPGTLHKEAMPSNLQIPELKLDNVSELPYLTLFTPLILSSTTTTALKSNQVLQSHSIKFLAPAPFKPHQFCVAFQLVTDPLSQTVTSLSLTKVLPTREHKELRRFIDQRLGNPIFEKDLGGLGWGLGRYWEGLLERAKVWKAIEEALPQFMDPTVTSLASEKIETQEPLMSLSPYLWRSALILRSGSNLQKGLLITYTLDVGHWTSQIQTNVGICADGTGTKVEEQVRKAFRGLVGRIGVVGAVKGVANMVLES